LLIVAIEIEENFMRSDLQGKTLIHMQQGAGGLWDVTEVGISEPLASFDDVEKCVDYASNVAREKDGVVVQMLD
jgi:hypothetical protein